MNNYYTISAAYQWPKADESTTNSQLAVRHLVNHLMHRLDTIGRKFEQPFLVNYRRLHASAGHTVLDSIIESIERSNALIVDITKPNKNVHIELGIAIMHKRHRPDFRLYLIRERTGRGKSLDMKNVPSDIHGTYISEYVVNEVDRTVTFKDNNSLLMSLATDVTEYSQRVGNIRLPYDEINADFETDPLTLPTRDGKGA